MLTELWYRLFVCPTVRPIIRRTPLHAVKYVVIAMNAVSEIEPTVVVGAPVAKALTPRQDAFARAYASTGLAVDSYRAAYACEGSSQATVRVNASRLLHTPSVARRIRELQDAAAERAVRSNAALMADLEEMVDANPGELVRIETGACRCCWGEHGKHQWRHEAEYAAACDAALADPGTPWPSIAGGFGYDTGRPPNPDCGACDGKGLSRVVYGSTAEVSRAAQRLVRGVETWPDGTLKRLHLHDQTALRIELHKLRGLHIERSVSLNVNASVPTPKDMTAAQALDYLESLRPTAPRIREPVTLDHEP